MQVVPGSHLRGQIPFERSTDEEQNILSQTVHEVERFGDTPVSIDLKAGQMSLHGDLLLHGSSPNTSNRRRCGLTLRYCPPSVKPIKANTLDKPWPAILVRGKDRFNHFGHWEWAFA